MAWRMVPRRCDRVHSEERSHDRITVQRRHRIDVKNDRNQKFRHDKDKDQCGKDQYRFFCDKGFFRRFKDLDTGSKTFFQLCHISCQKVIYRQRHFYGKDFHDWQQCPLKRGQLKRQIDCQSFQKHIHKYFNLRKAIHYQIIISLNAGTFKFVRQLLCRQVIVFRQLFRQQIIFYQQWKLLRRQIIRWRI